MAVVLVVVVVVAGVAYVFVFANPGPPGATTTATSTLSLGTSTPTAHTTVTTETLGGTTASSGSQGYEDFSGSFTYVVPLGPSGINDSTGKPIQWNSTQTASGSFMFSINPATYIGSGSGMGTITVATRGYCTGSSTVQYTFAIQAVLNPETKNVTIDFDLPTPSTVMVQLACQGSTVGFYTANNPVTYLSVYPNGLDLNSFPAKVSSILTGGISYTVNISQTS
jgi:hypothetical protein